MTRPPSEPDAVTTLRFKPEARLVHVDDPLHKDLSAVARNAHHLFFSCDETSGVDRLDRQEDGWGDHRHFNLGEIFDLPGGPDGEMDIEGLEEDDGWLWIVGSHSTKRGKPGDGDGRRAALDAMAKIKRDRNRFFLARVPLGQGATEAQPLAEAGDRKAASLKLHKTKSKLCKWLKGDAHLGRFLDIPSKENGLDIEGIAARGLRVWLGLRGPVLRAHAVILDLEFKITGSGHLKARRIDGKHRYRKHLIPTGGMGVRDLKRDGDDLMILTGTTMAGDGPARILRWKNAALARKSAVRDPADFEVAADLPYRGPVDHPEGLTRLEDGRWLVVYDSPAEARLQGPEGTVTADIWSLD